MNGSKGKKGEKGNKESLLAVIDRFLNKLLTAYCAGYKVNAIVINIVLITIAFVC